MKILPGKVIVASGGKWNFTVVVDDVEKVITTRFDSTATAKAAMRSFVDGARFAHDQQWRDSCETPRA